MSVRRDFCAYSMDKVITLFMKKIYRSAWYGKQKMVKYVIIDKSEKCELAYTGNDYGRESPAYS